MTLKEIREKSSEHITEMFPTVYDFRIEEVEKNKNFTWTVVVSFLVKNINIAEQRGIMGINTITNLPYERIFKTLLLSNKGELVKVSMFKG